VLCGAKDVPAVWLGCTSHVAPAMVCIHHMAAHHGAHKLCGKWHISIVWISVHAIQIPLHLRDTAMACWAATIWHGSVRTVRTCGMYLGVKWPHDIWCSTACMNSSCPGGRLGSTQLADGLTLWHRACAAMGSLCDGAVCGSVVCCWRIAVVAMMAEAVCLCPLVLPAVLASTPAEGGPARSSHRCAGMQGVPILHEP
jgi:hypothetical protein